MNYGKRKKQRTKPTAIDRMTQEQSDIRLLIIELLEIERQQLKAIKETNYGEEAGKK